MHESQIRRVNLRVHVVLAGAFPSIPCLTNHETLDLFVVRRALNPRLRLAGRSDYRRRSALETSSPSRRNCAAALAVATPQTGTLAAPVARSAAAHLPILPIGGDATSSQRPHQRPTGGHL